MTRVVLASHNSHKLQEFQQLADRLVPGLRFEAYDGPEPVEDGLSFEANALIKARAAASHTGFPALADDSGICVDVLGGAPGIFSARWSGHHGADVENNQLLLAQLADVAPEARGAGFVCVLALVNPDGSEQTVRASWRGKLATTPFGGGGFGYDPIFLPDDTPGRSSAELAPEQKNARSHRALAFEAAAPLLRALV